MRDQIWLPVSLLVTAVALISVVSFASEPEPHVLMISIDGLVPSSYMQPGPARIPMIRQLAAEGAFVDRVMAADPGLVDESPSRDSDLAALVAAASGRGLRTAVISREVGSTDEERATVASVIIKTHRPHLAVVHFTALDSVQRATGPESPEAIATLEQLDGHVGTLVRALEAAGL